MKRITGEDISEALSDVEKGADVYEYSDAKLYRDLEKLGLVKIVKAMGAPKDGSKRQPYFGCIISELGLTVLKSYRKWKDAN